MYDFRYNIRYYLYCSMYFCSSNYETHTSKFFNIEKVTYYENDEYKNKYIIKVEENGDVLLATDSNIKISDKNEFIYDKNTSNELKYNIKSLTITQDLATKLEIDS